MTRQLILFGRVIRAGVLSFFRNLWLSTAATAIMIITLVIILGTFIINRALDDTIQNFAEDITVSVYLDDTATDEAQQALESAIDSDEAVKEVVLISKEEARQLYIEANADDPELLDVFDIVGENTFPASFEVELVELSENQSLVDIFEDEQYASVVENYDQDRLNTASEFGNAQEFIARAGITLAIVFAVISILIIFNTIRMAIFTRQNEIEIMQLIGATNNYIRGPFLAESVIYGVIAGFVSLTITFFAVERLNSTTILQTIDFTGVAAFFDANQLSIGFIVVGTGMAIGFISSLIAMSRYLRLKT